MQIKLPQMSTTTEPQKKLHNDINSEKDKNKTEPVQANKNTDKGSVSLSVKARKSYEESLKEAEESLPVPVKLLKAQLARLQQRLVDIKQEIDQIKENNRLDDETKNSMLIAKQDEVANVMGAMQTVNIALLDAMKPPS